MKNIIRAVAKFFGYKINKISALPVGAFIDIDLADEVNRINVIFDVGANIGQTSLYFKKIFKKAVIYSFEPVSKTFKILEEATESYEDIHCFRFAFGQESKRDLMFVQEASNTCSLKSEINKQCEGRHLESEMVEVITLDSFCEKNGISKIDLLKIDTEGYELEVLKGSSVMFNKNAIKYIYAEIGFNKENVQNTYFPELYDFLLLNNFQLIGIYEQTKTHEKELAFANALFLNRTYL